MFSCPAINAFHPEKIVDSNQDIILKPIFTLGKIQEIQNILLCCRLMDEIVGQQKDLICVTLNVFYETSSRRPQIHFCQSIHT